MYRTAIGYTDPSGLDAMLMDCVSAAAVSLSLTAGFMGCKGWPS